MSISKPPLIVAAAAVISIGLCLGYFAYQQNLAQQKADQQEAEAKLKDLMRAKEWSQEQARQNEEWAQQVAAQKQAAEEAEQARPHYSKQQLAVAAKPHVWAPITVPDLNIKCVFNSFWTDGQLHYRVAMLGDKSVMESFLASNRAFKVNLADQWGTPVLEFPVEAGQFVLDPPSVNNGIPTMETNGNFECDLGQYQQGVQWNFIWVP